jgi:hypothetical protein
MIFLNPQKEWAGIMESQPNARVFFDQSEEGVIRILIALFEDMLEVARWLVGVNNQDDVEGRAGLRR